MGFGLLGGIQVTINRYNMRIPLYAALHRSIFTVALFMWAGYQCQKLMTMKNMGQYKYALDFAERHSVSYKTLSKFKKFSIFLPNFVVKIGEICLNTSTQKNPELISYTYLNSGQI